MAAVLESRSAGQPLSPATQVPPLENGDRLTAREFLRRYTAMPGVKKAELIEGIVYMGSPVRLKHHARPDAIVQTWLGTYAARTPGTEHATNATTRLDVDNVPQPDALLRVLPEWGGHSQVDAEGYLAGAPELAVEICASSASIDLRDKLNAYRRAGIREYLVWRTVEKQFQWLALENEDYCPIPPDPEGLIRSRVFPGLWLEVPSLLALDSGRILDILQQGLASPEHQEFVRQLNTVRAR